ncbi:MAG: response regulator [Deltaproteobacteria bacterium]|nr:response regulator [Deltaproteobacteria bacterium]NIS78225.1 response regulator [Deltaproteobacteria bacterium]
MSDRGKVFILDDDDLIVSTLTWALANQGYDVSGETGTEKIVDKIRSSAPDVVLLDIALPGMSGIDILEEMARQEIPSSVVMLTSDKTAETAVTAMKIGAVDYITKPFNLEEVKIIIGNIIENRRLRQEVDYLRTVSADLFEKEIIGESKAISELLDRIEKIAKAGVDTILITGESGTGKELVARYIHIMMHAAVTPRQAPFIGINCAAFPETLLESELFGYTKGAFTDAKADKKGIFEAARGGTILLDEIGEMKPDLQSKLLRVLEERAIRQIGGKEEVPIDVTVIATTNKNLLDSIEKGSFRTDLYYRLNTFPLHIVPLRERVEDIPVLARHYLTYFGTRYNKKTPRGISPEAERLMVSCRWRGNVRELRNVIERIVVLESDELIMPEHLPKEMQGTSAPTAVGEKGRFILPEGGLSLDELEKDLMVQALERTNHNKTQAAELLNISYESIRYHIKKYGLE